MRRLPARALRDAELGLGNTVHINAYRLASLVPACCRWILADRLPPAVGFAITALFMLPGLLLTWRSASRVCAAAQNPCATRW